MLHRGARPNQSGLATTPPPAAVDWVTGAALARPAGYAHVLRTAKDRDINRHCVPRAR
jgi:hypothetical protein